MRLFSARLFVPRTLEDIPVSFLEKPFNFRLLNFLYQQLLGMSMNSWCHVDVKSRNLMLSS